MTREQAKQIRTLCVACALRHPDFRMTMQEHTEFENLCTITLATQGSREEQCFMSYEIDQFKAIADAVSCTYSVQLTQDQKGLEFVIC